MLSSYCMPLFLSKNTNHSSQKEDWSSLRIRFSNFCKKLKTPNIIFSHLYPCCVYPLLAYLKINYDLNRSLWGFLRRDMQIMAIFGWSHIQLSDCLTNFFPIQVFLTLFLPNSHMILWPLTIIDYTSILLSIALYLLAVPF